MGNLNKVFVIGRLCFDPEIKQVNEHTVLNNSLAVDESYKDKNGVKQEKAEFIRISAWNHSANIIHKYCRKGSQIYVEGSLQTRKWNDKEGNERFTTEVNVKNVQLLDSKSSDNQQQKQGTEQYQQQKQPSTHQYNQQDDVIEDDIPF